MKKSKQTIVETETDVPGWFMFIIRVQCVLTSLQGGLFEVSSREVRIKKVLYIGKMKFIDKWTDGGYDLS